MGLFKPKYPRLEDAEKDADKANATAGAAASATPSQTDKPQSSEGANRALSADIIKLKAQFDQFAEMRKLVNERFSRISEQTGELRGMIMDTNRSMQDMEVKTVKAVDLVEAVHPDKLMVDVRKQDAKIEALKANIESNDSIMKSLMDQLKEVRQKVTTFSGVDQTVKLAGEVKEELMQIKKTEASVQRHADKVDQVYIESQKKFQEFEKIEDKIKEIQKQVGPATQAIDQLKVKVQTYAVKKDMENLITKLNTFEKHVGNVIDILTKRSNELPKEINDRFKKLEDSMNKTFETKLKRAEAMNKLIDQIEEKATKVAKEIQIQAKLQDLNVKEIQSDESADIAESVEESEKERKGFFAKLFSKKEKKEEK
jgi:DNA repair exonuclease SbcCD ATPase subunit